MIYNNDAWRFIAVNGLHFQEDAYRPWLDAALPGLRSEKLTVVYTHFPLAAGVTHRPANAPALLDRFIGFNQQTVLSGHWHGRSESRWRDAVLTTNRYCSRARDNHDVSPQKGWLVCEIEGGQLRQRFVEVPAKRADEPDWN